MIDRYNIKFNVYRLKEAIKIIESYFVNDKKKIAHLYKEAFGIEADLDNPKSLNEKIQWLKINDRTPLHEICADKYKVREYIENRVGSNYLIPLLNVFNNFHEIEIEKLPNKPFVIKSNHYCGDVILCRNKNELSIGRIKSLFCKSMAKNLYLNGREWQYKNIEKKIIVEQMLICKDGSIPKDYKIHCFNGKAKFIYVASDREGDNYRNIYDVEWVKMDFSWARKGKDISKFNKVHVERPKQLSKMINLAEVIARDFKYVRVDLYLKDEDIYFGEITFHQGSGFDHITPSSMDDKLGSMLTL